MAMLMPDLPVRAVLPRVAEALTDGRNVVLQAPPGTGKTLLTAPFLLGHSPWLDGKKILLLEPRRLAARLAANSMARLMSETAGETVGYSVRLERVVGPKTRIEVLTEGLLSRRLVADPSLDGVGLVIFDEFHERSLSADFGLALALESRAILRDDLRLMVMSATLDANATAAMLGEGTEIIAASARLWPIETVLSQHTVLPQNIPLEMSNAVRRALDETDGGILAFLPGESEIRRTASLLAECGLPMSVKVLPLYSALGREAQDAAVTPLPPSQRKIILATSIAESSVTIPDISVVIDCGWMRVSRFSPATGMSRLATVRITRDRADQRRGRAGRIGPGICYRLWDKSVDTTLQPESPPEIVNADLAETRLEAAAWGAIASDDLPWPTRPPELGWRKAGVLLESLDAIGSDGRIKTPGRRMLRISAHPRLAHAIEVEQARGFAREAAICAAIVEEMPSASFLRGEDDLDWIFSRIADIDRERGDSDNFASGDSAAKGESISRVFHDWALRILRLARQWTPKSQLLRTRPVAQSSYQGSSQTTNGCFSTARFLALAFPDRVAQSRDGGAMFKLMDGHGAKVAPGSRLFGKPMIVAAELQDADADAIVRLGASIAPEAIVEILGYLATEEEDVRWDSRTERIIAARKTKIGALTIASHPVETPSREARLRAFASAIKSHGLAALDWTRESHALQARIQFLHNALPGNGWPDVSDDALARDISSWLGDWLDNISTWQELARLDLYQPLMAFAGHRRRELDSLAPEYWMLPCGHRARIDYTQGSTPVIAAKLQDFFGVKSTPLLAGGRIIAKISMLSPAQRPIAITDNLERFWHEGYPLVRKEYRGRYPKHNWPEPDELV